MKTVRIGAGAGFSGDRIEPAVELAEKGDLDFLVFECLAERTIALAQQARLRDPAAGFDPLLVARMRAVLPACRAGGVRIITNMGAANPLAAAEAVREVARELGLQGLRVAAVTGDDVLAEVQSGDYQLDETSRPISELDCRVISANAYLGATPIAEALSQGAEVVVTGRAADPALFLGPLIHAFGWSMDDWTRLGRGTIVGHLLECAGQITGGYFADPGYKDVPDLARLGFPIGEVDEEGNVTVTKVKGSGGAVTPATVKEQLLYEVHDPARYLQPDVAADFSGVVIEALDADSVRVTGGGGSARTGSLKVSVGYIDSYVGEGQISYAGPGAMERGRLAVEIVAERLKIMGVACQETRGELIGVDSILGARLSANGTAPREVRVRFVGRTDSLEEAERVGNEVESLYLNGPAGGGGAAKSTREIVGIVSTLIPETQVRTAIDIQEA
ncbi:acyclic terpene utilization AtuA family protein [Pararhodobacter sp. SW119]|uniref:acyclic terpene utilization AtuA family protein n=1 Tax=Pararhodobacter sp. SW119 TaxID=2780075 RepID=UPI001ADF5426|nr:acyclic terpene utilization AtuA family protein [Pararhodobacter sp. SW119]